MTKLELENAVAMMNADEYKCEYQANQCAYEHYALFAGMLIFTIVLTLWLLFGHRKNK
jgi:hypothetical protein